MFSNYFLFFFSILLCVLCIESSPTKSEIDLAQESIEERLKAYSNDSDKIRYLIQKMAKDRVSHKQELIDVVAKVCRQGAKETVRKEHTVGLSLKEALDPVLRACLTSKALDVLERFAFIYDLYKSTDMDWYEKWAFALLMFNNTILENIRADLQRSNLSYEQFAGAAYEIHSLIPEEYVKPVLQTCTSYPLPTKKEDIETFCSFLDMYLANKYNETVASSLKQAADLVCLSTFKYHKEIEHTKAAEKARRYAATIIIEDDYQRGNL
ncbi:uncharacterized protein LOC135847289 [Planococcus citri]|uniref:uncharacterized protein LOC135847289 n=1 Tax=Planococcus citri TaxID=170843 RepID=UPI0031F9349E